MLAAIAIKNTIINVVDIKSEYPFVTGDFESFVKVVSGGETDQRLDVAAGLLIKLIVVNEKILDEIRETRLEMAATHNELKATHEELKESINESHDAVVNEIQELRVGLKENLEGRLIRIESDVSQIKEKIDL